MKLLKKPVQQHEQDRPLGPVAEAARPQIVRAKKRKRLLVGPFSVEPTPGFEPRKWRRLVAAKLRQEPHELAVMRPILRGLADNIRDDAALEAHARILGDAYFNNGRFLDKATFQKGRQLARIVDVAPDLRQWIETTRPPLSLTLDDNWRSSWGIGRFGPVDDVDYSDDLHHFLIDRSGLSYEQRALVAAHRQYAIKRADSFWSRRTHFLNSADRADLRQVAQLELCLTAKTFDPSLGFSFATPLQKALTGAFYDWMRERYSVVHRSREAWDKGRARWGGEVSWFDDSLEIPVDDHKQEWITKDLPDHGQVEAASERSAWEKLNFGTLLSAGWQIAESCLTPRELEVFRARHTAHPFDRPSQKQLAERLGIRPDSVSALEVSARKKFAEAARLLLANKWQK